MSAETLPTTDLVVERGDSLTIELGPVIVTDYLGVSQPIDLTAPGTRLWVTIKESVDDIDPGIAQVSQAGGVTLDFPATTGKNFATAFFDDGTFDDLIVFAQRKVLVWDAVWELGTRHERIARGKVTVVPSVTRAT